MATDKPQRLSLTRQCIRSIRSYIQTNCLQAGEKLPSFQEWTEILGVSVVVVREAFRSMEALGLVDIQHGRGIFLRNAEQVDFLDFLASRHALNEFTTQEIVEARAMLDLVVLELCIARANQETIDQLDQILQLMFQNPSLVAVGSQLHKRFHQVMLEASGNKFLVGIGTPLMNTFWNVDTSGQIPFLSGPYEFNEVDCHAAYVSAIRSRDLTDTRQLVDRHLIGLCTKYGVFPHVAIRSETPLP